MNSTQKRSDMMKKREIAQIFGLSEATVQKYVREIESEMIGSRYARYAVIRNGNILLINIVVFMDYLKNREVLRQKSVRKYAPKFDYETTKQYMGLEVTQ